MLKPKLHLDADSSQKALHKALLKLDHDVTRTPNDWMPLAATDATQLLKATEQGRIIFTFNIGDFMRLAAKQPNHAGIILAQQRDWPLARQIKALNRLLTETTAVSWHSQVRWLNDWLGYNGYSVCASGGFVPDTINHRPRAISSRSNSTAVCSSGSHQRRLMSLAAMRLTNPVKRFFRGVYQSIMA